MKDRKRHHTDAQEQGSAPPRPEAQGDGEPAPAHAASGAREGAGRPQANSTDEPDSGDAGEGASGGSPADDGADSGLLSRQLAEQREKYLRLAAEYDNYRKRTQKERLEAGARGQAELILRMLEAVDDLGRFADIDPATTDAQTLHKGIELVEQKLLKTLVGSGLEVINPVDQSFDPNEHEAITTEPALSPEDDHTVSRVYQLGYRFGGQLLRPARVVVKQWNQS